MVIAVVTPVRAHDLERTQVVLTFSRDGSFVLDVSNDPAWLTLRLESFKGPFADRVVLWVDGREIRPESAELVAPRVERADGASAGALATWRLRGRMPLDAKTLRFYYGLVIDPYPLTVRRADGRIIVEEVQGDAWSRPIDLAGQFDRQTRWPIYVVALMLVAAIVTRARGINARRRN